MQRHAIISAGGITRADLMELTKSNAQLTMHQNDPVWIAKNNMITGSQGKAWLESNGVVMDARGNFTYPAGMSEDMKMRARAQYLHHLSNINSSKVFFNNLNAIPAMRD